MINFCDKRTNTKKTAFSIRKDGNKVFVKFTEGGKEYSYFEDNIEILDSKPFSPLIIYSLEQPCYKCKKTTEVLTYMLFADGTNENLTFPWDKQRLNRKKSMDAHMAHMSNPDIEFYPIMVIGSDEVLDKFMLAQYPKRIRMEYSATQKRTYPMNICQHCGAKQGEFFIYQRLNKIIKKMEELKIYETNIYILIMYINLIARNLVFYQIKTKWYMWSIPLIFVKITVIP